MHCVMASLVPEMVTARSVELGSISDATCIDAPVTSRISLILEPPLPMREPHCDAGTMRRSVIGGRGMPDPLGAPCISWNCNSNGYLHHFISTTNLSGNHTSYFTDATEHSDQQTIWEVQVQKAKSDTGGLLHHDIIKTWCT